MKGLLIKLPALIIMGISWYLSSKSVVSMPDFQNSDKFVHFICFAGLAFCWCFWFSLEKWNKNPLFCLTIVTVIVSAYGIIDEIHQYFVPGRFASVSDWLADTAGGICGATAGLLASKLYPKIKGSRHGDNSMLP